jgi:dihydroneopterin aldolase
VSDSVFVRGMEFECRIGVSDEERAEPQMIELDVELELDLRPAGTSDDLTRTVDYGAVFDTCREIAESGEFRLLEGLAERVASEILATRPAVDGVVVTARKPGVPIDGVLEHAGVRIERSRA